MRVVELRDKILRVKGRLSEGTRRNYTWVLGKLAARVEDWPSESWVIDEFLGGLELRDTTIRGCYRLLRAVGRYAKKAYGLPDPTENAERPKVEHRRRRYFSKEELAAIINACRDVRERGLILALLDSAARIGELAGLRVTDLREDHVLVHGKSGQRRYRCDPRLVAILRDGAVEGVVFPALVDGSMTRLASPVRATSGVVLSGRVHRIMKRAGLVGEKLGPHTLRHTAASMVAKKTMSALAVKALLQHDKVATSEIYIHDVDEVIQQQVSPLKMLGSVVPGNVEAPLQLEMPKESRVVEGVIDLVEDLLPHASAGVGVRPLLKTEDLELIRAGFVELMHRRNENGSGSACVQLMRRMLRRVR